MKYHKTYLWSYMKGGDIIDYIAMYHDRRDLYEDVLIGIWDTVKDGSIHKNYAEHANEIVAQSFDFDDDGDWRLVRLIKFAELRTHLYT